MASLLNCCCWQELTTALSESQTSTSFLLLWILTKPTDDDGISIFQKFSFLTIGRQIYDLGTTPRELKH